MSLSPPGDVVLEQLVMLGAVVLIAVGIFTALL
jgi:hypothetical protein